MATGKPGKDELQMTLQWRYCSTPVHCCGATLHISLLSPLWSTPVHFALQWRHIIQCNMQERSGQIFSRVATLQWQHAANCRVLQQTLVCRSLADCGVLKNQHCTNYSAACEWSAATCIALQCTVVYCNNRLHVFCTCGMAQTCSVHCCML